MMGGGAGTSAARAFRLAMLTAIVTLCLFAMCEPQSAIPPQFGPSLVEGAGLFAAGLAVGGYGTVVGIGGGPLLVPILHFMYAWPIEEVVASSLFVVLLNATS